MISSFAVSNLRRIILYLQAKKMGEKQQNSSSCVIEPPYLSGVSYWTIAKTALSPFRG